jgi:hypothetical protein
VNTLSKMRVAHVYGRRWLMELTTAKACRETGEIEKDKLIFSFICSDEKIKT